MAAAEILTLPETVTPFDGAVIAILEAAAFVGAFKAAEMFNEKPADLELAPESSTFVIKVNVPAVATVPAMNPVVEFSVRPLGSCPPVCAHE